MFPYFCSPIYCKANTQLRNDASYTSTLCSWSAVSTKKFECAPICKIDFTTPQKKRKSATGDFSNTVPVSTAPDQEPVEEELQELYGYNNDSCSIGWYHIDCINIDSIIIPSGSWYCPECSGKMTKYIYSISYNVNTFQSNGKTDSQELHNAQHTVTILLMSECSGHIVMFMGKVDSKIVCLCNNNPITLSMWILTRDELE